MASTTTDHAADIDRHVRVYITVFVALMVLTIVTVAISRVHLPVPIAVTVALIVATIKGGLVACYFMHLISEKKLILWVLALTVVFFIALLALPAITHGNGFWIHVMNLRSVHALLILLSAILAVLFGVWCLGQYGRGNGVANLLAAVTAFALSAGLVVYDSWFLRKTRTLR